MKPNSAAMFWANVRREGDGCWPWRGRTTTSGYGQFAWSGKDSQAHRIAAFLTGLIKQVASSSGSKGADLVLHRCDNRICCRPSHLFVGTAADNNRDRNEKGRWRTAKGEQHGSAKLSASDVAEIRRLYSPRANKTLIASLYGVDRSTVARVLAGRTWRDALAKGSEG